MVHYVLRLVLTTVLQTVNVTSIQQSVRTDVLLASMAGNVRRTVVSYVWISYVIRTLVYVAVWLVCVENSALTAASNSHLMAHVTKQHARGQKQ